MLKAAVFDDEFIVTEGLKKMIDWSSYGIELVGTAQNGSAGLTLFKEHKPDIIFTDIRMPGIDGLELVEKILSEAPETQCIVFSGFSEFEYARRAIQLGVVDYLEKPITIPMIDEAIKKLLERINKQKTLSSLKEKLESSREELLQKTTLDFIQIGPEVLEKWKELFGEESSKITAVTAIATSSKEFTLLKDHSYRVVSVRSDINYLHVVFHFTKDINKLWEQLLFLSEDMSFHIGSGKTYFSLNEISKTCKEALDALKYGSFLEKNGWIRYEDVGSTSRLTGEALERADEIIFYIRTGNKQGLLKQVELFISDLEAEKLTREIAEREILKLVYLAMEVAKETGGDIYEMKQNNYLPHIEIVENKTKEDMLTWLRLQMEMIMNWTLNVRNTTKHASVEKAIFYMKQNLNRDLTLQEVAEHVGMNATYFSVLFKEEMEVSYIKYLTKLRIERAKVLLKEGNKVSVVSEKVGYHSYRHFSDIFKKHTGFKPSDYKGSV
ncbi:response regulator [Metabacillus litoralis]|uniref:response regulator transcription factor n=1 Tax=Metabacillus litoralis TaxID=152268 RepID=UPI001B94A1E1|nr:response regulator [Metabacillus litoralis]MCM3412757.1 response regulator [Metabacillus litoralis]UHA59996.1 response regulator [Metabacillus litoralis]